MTTAVPTKVQAFLTSACRRGLSAEETQGRYETRVWEIRHPTNRYRGKLWIYWTPGPRGGRLHLYSYSTITHKSVKVTRPAALATIATMTDRSERSTP